MLPRCHEMHMVGHKDISMYCQAIALRRFKQATMEIYPVALRPEYGLAIIAPDYDMGRQVGQVDTGKAGHGKLTLDSAGGGHEGAKIKISRL